MSLKSKSRRSGLSIVGLVWLLCCLVGGAWLLTKSYASPPPFAHRTKAIEDVKVGDWVLASDPERSGVPMPHKVTDLHKNWSEHWVHLQLQGIIGEVISTRSHPFWTLERGWIFAKDVKVGDYLVEPTGGGHRVQSVSFEDRVGDTFNFEVADVHTYYVGIGNTAVLVHNGNGSYTITFGSGTVYDGKGDYNRAKESGRIKARQYGDPVAGIDYSPASGKEDSFLQEEFRMRKNSGG